MPRPATGHIRLDERAKNPAFEARFTAYGKRRSVRLGRVADGMTSADAQVALEKILAEVKLGIWAPTAPVVQAEEPAGMPTFHVWASSWWARAQHDLEPNTKADYTWRLSNHLLPYFGDFPLDTITYKAVESYAAAKLTEGERIRKAEAAGKPILVPYVDKHGVRRKRRARPLSSRSINMHVTLLGAILELACEHDLISRNPARGKARKVKETIHTRAYLSSATQIIALLDTATEMDLAAPGNRRHVARHAMIATLLFSGLRISELMALRWRDVDLASGWLTVADSKTEAGRRTVKIRGAVRDVLDSLDRGLPLAYVFPTSTGQMMGANNFRARVLKPCAARASEALATAGHPPLPEDVTPHALRRTFCSLLYALGETPPVVMAEMGHTDPAMALALYAKLMRRGEDERRQLAALIDGGTVEKPGAGFSRLYTANTAN